MTYNKRTVLIKKSGTILLLMQQMVKFKLNSYKKMT